MPWANFDFEKPIKSVPANSASTKSQKLPINQSNNNQTKLLLSRESNESVSHTSYIQKAGTTVEDELGA